MIKGMLTILLGLTGVVFATDTFAQGTWTTNAAMPTARTALQGAAVNDLLYAVGGNNGGDTPIVEAYNPRVKCMDDRGAVERAPNYGGNTGRYADFAWCFFRLRSHSGKNFVLGQTFFKISLRDSRKGLYGQPVQERQPAVRMAELAEAGRPFWFCLKAAPKREHLAATTLRREFKMPVLAPRIRFRKLTSRGPVWFVEAMFPGYLFAEFIYRDLHRRVVHTHGVTGLVRFGDHVPTIEPAALDSLRTAHDQVITVDRPLEVGETVKIAEGPFQGFEAIVTRLLPAAKRVQILLEFLGRGIEIAVHEPQIIYPKLRMVT